MEKARRIGRYRQENTTEIRTWRSLIYLNRVNVMFDDDDDDMTCY